MCRGKRICSELGSDSAAWDRQAPLRPPAWMSREIDMFVSAIDDFISNDRNACLEKIACIRSSEITDWYIEHGQMSGKHRNFILNVAPQPTVSVDERDPIRSPLKLQEAVFQRDGYRCRYCGNRLISQDFMKHFITQLDSGLFARGLTNRSTHGIIHLTWPVADHVVPWNKGGRTSLQNLVSSCAPCNYGKDGYTLEQLGLESPYSNTPVIDEWLGLKNQVQNFKANSELNQKTIAHF